MRVIALAGGYFRLPVIFLLVIILSVHRFTTSYYPYGVVSMYGFNLCIYQI